MFFRGQRWSAGVYCIAYLVESSRTIKATKIGSNRKVIAVAREKMEWEFLSTLKGKIWMLYFPDILLCISNKCLFTLTFQENFVLIFNPPSNQMKDGKMSEVCWLLWQGLPNKVGHVRSCLMLHFFFLIQVIKESEAFQLLEWVREFQLHPAIMESL